MTGAKFDTVEHEVEILQWRLHERLKAGYDRDAAVVLTTHREVDLHLAIDLPRRGCPHATAVRILL